MDNKNLRESEKQGEERRRPYERPAVRWEEDFEPYIFSVCGKMGSTIMCIASMRS